MRKVSPLSSNVAHEPMGASLFEDSSAALISGELVSACVPACVNLSKLQRTHSGCLRVDEDHLGAAAAECELEAKFPIVRQVIFQLEHLEGVSHTLVWTTVSLIRHSGGR